MAYEKQNFSPGQVLTADCLNRMENGIEEVCNTADNLSSCFQTESGIIKRGVLPAGFPYAEDDEVLIDNADTSALAEKSNISVPCNRPLNVGETCQVIWETEEQTYIATAVGRDNSNGAATLVWVVAEDGKTLGAIYFWNDKDSTSARIDQINKIPLRVTVTVPGEVTKIDKKYLPEDIEAKSVILPSSTSGSAKRFKITVDDTGTLTAIEI